MAEEQLRELGPEAKDLVALVRKLKRIIAEQDKRIKELEDRLDVAGIP